MLDQCSVNVNDIDDDLSIVVINYGLYIAKFTVTYEHEENSETFVTDYFLVNEIRSFNLPVNSKNIFFKIEIMIFISTWRTLYSTVLNSNDKVCFTISGTTLHPIIQHCAIEN